MRALLLLEKDNTTHVKYHEAHIDKFSDYEDGKARLLASQVEGSVSPDFRVLMAYNSLTFSTCQPINHRHASLGFYDKLPKNNHQDRKSPVEDPLAMDVDSKAAPATPRSFVSDSQRNVKNHAYVELKHPQLSRRASKKIPVSGTPLSSSREHSDGDEPPLVNRCLLLRPSTNSLFLERF
jgi:hypothetical protein